MLMCIDNVVRIHPVSIIPQWHLRSDDRIGIRVGGVEGFSVAVAAAARYLVDKKVLLAISATNRRKRESLISCD